MSWFACSTPLSLLLCLTAICFAGDQPSRTETSAIRRSASLPESTPWDLQKLSEVPDFTWADEREIRSLYYAGEEYQGKSTRVFAYYATPDTIEGNSPSGKRYPAVVLVHGGGGAAFSEWVKLWAKRGYAAIAMDLAGCGPNRVRMPDGGPGQGHDMKFETIGLPKTRQWTYHAVANVIRAHSLIQSFAEVDSKRTAVTGISWGGYLTCIVAGLDDRFQAAVPVYGCGFLHENSAWLGDFAKMSSKHQRKWVELWDPSQYVGAATMPMLFVNGGRDFAYPPDSYAKTYSLVKSPKNLHFVPDLPHGHIFDRPKAIEAFIAHQLNKGTPLPRVTNVRIANGVINANVISEIPLAGAQLCYTDDAMSGDSRKRNWVTSPAAIDGKSISVVLPSSTATTWFVTVMDERGVLVASELVVSNN